MRGRPGTFLIGVVVLLGAIAAACGGDAPAAPEAPTAAPAPTGAAVSTSTPAPTVQATATTVAQASPLPTATALQPTPVPVSDTPVPSATVQSDIVGFKLEELVVTVGTKVTWTNQDPVEHTTTSGSRGDSTGIWDSGNLAQGDSFSFTFTEEGTFPYFCRVHPTLMNSTVTVAPKGRALAATATATPLPPTATPAPAAPSPTPEPTQTAVPPTMSTPAPPTATAVPPTATTVPPIPTPAPPPQTPSPTPTPQPFISNIQNFQLQNLNIPVGTTVTWVNLDFAAHTSTAGTPTNPRPQQWDSGTLQRDQTFTFTFDEQGAFVYFCRFHPLTMQATVTVVESGTPTASSTTNTGQGSSPY